MRKRSRCWHVAFAAISQSCDSEEGATHQEHAVDSAAMLGNGRRDDTQETSQCIRNNINHLIHS